MFEILYVKFYNPFPQNCMTEISSGLNIDWMKRAWHREEFKNNPEYSIRICHIVLQKSPVSVSVCPAPLCIMCLLHPQCLAQCLAHRVGEVATQ